MADEATPPAPPSQPANTPATPVKSFPVVPVAILSVVAIAIAVGVTLFLVHRSEPPAPVPPAPIPDSTPVASLAGSFWPNVSAGLNAEADGTPVGMFLLDASKSHSTRPLRWKVKGPGATINVLTPASGTPGSLAQAFATGYGTHEFSVTAVGITGGEPDADIAVYSRSVTAPEPPKPPGPPPGPFPPPEPPAPPKPPAPPEPAAPIPGDGLRVLIVYEANDLGKYPKNQLAVMYDQKFRDHLAATCPKVDGQPEWRIYDKDTDMSNESKTWQDAMKRPHPELPWIVVSNGKTGYEGKLPANVAETMSLVQKYEVKP